MKLFYLLFILILFISSCQNSSKIKNDKNIIDDRVEILDSIPELDSLKVKLRKILKQLKIEDNDLFYRLSQHQVLPKYKNLTVWVIPIEKDVEYGNPLVYEYILLTDTKSSKIISRYYHFYERTNDPYRFYTIDIDTLNYTLNPNKVIFGINTFFKGASSVFIYDEYLSQLFMQDGDSIQPIFNYRKTLGQGEASNNEDTNWYMVYNTVLLPIESKTKGFLDLALWTKEQENTEVVTFRDYRSKDSINVFHYSPDEGYIKSNKTEGSIFEEWNEGGVGEQTYFYFNKTIDDVYQTIYDNEKDIFQKYMLPELPKESMSYTLSVKEEWYDSLTTTYTINKQNELQISFDTDMSGIHYFLREHKFYTKVLFSYHD